MAPEGAHVPVPRTCEYVGLNGKEESTVANQLTLK